MEEGVRSGYESMLRHPRPKRAQAQLLKGAATPAAPGCASKDLWEHSKNLPAAGFWHDACVTLLGLPYKG